MSQLITNTILNSIKGFKEVFIVGEEWRDIKNYEGLYQISNLGRVKSVKRTVWNNGRCCYVTVPERILKLKKNRYGYLQIVLHKDGNRKSYGVHRLVAEAFIPNPDNLPEVDHKNGRKLDNRANNLRWVTKEDNLRYMNNRRKDKKTREIETQFGKNNITTKNSSRKDKTKILHLETGKLYNSSRHAGRELNLSDANIRRSCKTNGRSAVKGNHFRYVI